MEKKPLAACSSPIQFIHLGLVLCSLGFPCLAADTAAGNFFNVRTFGATGDGKTLDSPAINRAIEAAAQAGGGTVLVPAGTYLSGSIHLRSNIHLQLEAGAIILGAPQKMNVYDRNRAWHALGGYQDGGHCLFSQQSHLGRKPHERFHHRQRHDQRRRSGARTTGMLDRDVRVFNKLESDRSPQLTRIFRPPASATKPLRSNFAATC